MGEVYKPEDFEKKKKRRPDIRPKPSPRPTRPIGRESMFEEIRALRLEVERIKTALRRHGILLE